MRRPTKTLGRYRAGRRLEAAVSAAAEAGGPTPPLWREEEREGGAGGIAPSLSDPATELAVGQTSE